MHYVRDPEKLLQAARTAVSLISLVHETLWELYPNEILLFREGDQNLLLAAIEEALRDFPLPGEGPDCESCPY